MGITCSSVKHFPLGDVWKKKKKKKEKKDVSEKSQKHFKKKVQAGFSSTFWWDEDATSLCFLFFHLVQQSKPKAHVVFQILGEATWGADNMWELCFLRHDRF